MEKEIEIYMGYVHKNIITITKIEITKAKPIRITILINHLIIPSSSQSYPMVIVEIIIIIHIGLDGI